MTLSILILSLLVLILLKMPVALALLTVSFSYILFNDGVTMRIALQQTVGGIDSFPLLAIPFFVLVGYLAVGAGIGAKLMSIADSIIGRIRGGLGYVNVSTSVMFSMMNGSALADTASMGRVLVPEMVQRGYSARFSVGVTGASSLIGAILPPSIPAVLYAVSAGTSVGGLFAAAILPTFLIALMLCVGVFIYSLYAKKQGVELVTSEKSTGREILRNLVKALPPLFTPVILLGGIFTGTFTPTEAGCIAVLYLFVLWFVYRGPRSFAALFGVVRDATSTTAGIMISIAAAGLYGWVLTREGAAEIIQEVMTSPGIDGNIFFFLIAANILMLVIGAVLDATPAILILVPILYPTAMAFGLDPLHFGVIMVLNLMIGLLTPPIGMVLFVLSRATGESFSTVMKGALPFIGILIAALLLISYIPEISLFLPELLGYGSQ